MKVLHINKDNFHNEVLNSDKPVLLDFFASWCGPCKMVSPILDEIAKEREDIKVCKVDIDEQPLPHHERSHADGSEKRQHRGAVHRRKTQAPDSGNGIKQSPGKDFLAGVIVTLCGNYNEQCRRN